MIESIIILIVGIAMIVLGLSLSNKQSRIKKIGLTAEGIVFDFVKDPTSSINAPYPVIRFLTLNQEWVTETANIAMFPGFYKKGQKVVVLYDEKNPKQFIIDSKTNKTITYTILLVGCLLILIGAYKLIGIELQ